MNPMQMLKRLLSRVSGGEATLPSPPVERPRAAVQRAAREAIRNVDTTCEIYDSKFLTPAEPVSAERT